MTKIKSTVALILVFLNLFTALTVNATPGFYYRDIYTGGVENIYLTTKDNIPVRTAPVAKANNVIARLDANELIVGNGLVVNSKGNRFIKITDENETYYIYENNLKLHNEHNFSPIPDYNPFRICIDCGKIVFGTPEEAVMKVTDTIDYIHAALFVCSFTPVGNYCDLADGALSLLEGDISAATMSFFAAIPLLGNLRYLDEGAGAVRVYDDAETIISAQMRNGTIEFFEEANSTILGRNLDDAFKKTGNVLYDKPGEIVQAHHIVCGNDPTCKPARIILQYLEIPLNSADNGVFLCGKTNICDDIGHHVGGHTRNYYETVNEMVKEAFDKAGPLKSEKKEAVQSVLSDIALQLKKGKLKVNKYTP